MCSHKIKLMPRKWCRLKISAETLVIVFFCVETFRGAIESALGRVLQWILLLIMTGIHCVRDVGPIFCC